jgi:hypothetical protein
MVRWAGVLNLLPVFLVLGSDVVQAEQQVLDVIPDRFLARFTVDPSSTLDARSILQLAEVRLFMTWKSRMMRFLI